MSSRPAHQQPPATDAGPLVLRSGADGVHVAHGVQELFGWFGGPGIRGTAVTFEEMEPRFGQASAVATGLGEAGGGALSPSVWPRLAVGAAAVGTMTPAAAWLCSACRPRRSRSRTGASA